MKPSLKIGENNILIKDLIALLEKEYQEQFKYVELFGEPSIVIDIFGIDKDNNISYKGFDNNIRITFSNDGCYRILTAWEEQK